MAEFRQAGPAYLSRFTDTNFSLARLTAMMYWEDAAMDREAGAEEAAAFVKDVDFIPSGRMFDEAFSTD